MDTADLELEEVPPTLVGAARELVLGAYKLADRLLLVLDTAPVLAVQTIVPARG